jgi:hypothetical protein
MLLLLPRKPDCSHTTLLLTPPLQVLSAISQLENSKAQQLAAMILATSQRLDQLWSKCTPTMVLGWLAKAQVSFVFKQPSKHADVSRHR